MRQKCDYCGTHPEINDKGKCPNCGAPIIVEFANLYNVDIPHYDDWDKNRQKYRPSGSFANFDPTMSGIPVRYMGNDIT